MKECNQNLLLVRPDVLQVTIMSGKAVDGVISFGFLANKTTESIGGEGVGGTAFFVHVSNIELDGSVVLGSDETVSGRARRGKESVKNLSFVYCIYHLRGM
jgi:hypothetical protein